MSELTDMNDITVFQEEISLITDKDLRLFVGTALQAVPNYFFHIPASSSGKYHPSYALGEGGLVRHTKAAIKIANELFNLEQYKFSEHDKDLIVVTLLLHDTYKSGYPQQDHTVFEHPLICVKNLYRMYSDGLHYFIHWWDFVVISYCVSSHMGQWNTSKYSNIVMPKPKTRLQKFVHLCDYLASRKFLEVTL
jgi:hypothetical protein